MCPPGWLRGGRGALELNHKTTVMNPKKIPLGPLPTTRRGKEALHRISLWGCLCCQQKEGGGPSYSNERISLCGLVTIQNFLVISSKGSAKVADRSPFKIHRELKSILGDETIEVTKLGSGDLMVELKSNDQARSWEQSRRS
ncbi:hypothetical protein PoB_001816000 [Plakobranchus ocellatus]|uniref:Uncharacterized protein n=1 Tax=Plakobranchus ocellatus TaxID=259542 RepID=A0AAV3Z830_9GAST|nr:hypothetical protein PoB_001816000 [Plakobranchus ocellatus]